MGITQLVCVRVLECKLAAVAGVCAAWAEEACRAVFSQRGYPTPCGLTLGVAALGAVASLLQAAYAAGPRPESRSSMLLWIWLLLVLTSPGCRLKGPSSACV